MDALFLAGAAVGGLVLLDSTGAAPGVTVGQSAGDGDAAAMNALRAAMPIAGVTWQVPTTNSPSSAFVQMRDTFVGQYGRITSSADIAPQGLSVQQLYQLGKAWLDAWSTGCTASSTARQNLSAGTDCGTGLGCATSLGLCDTSDCSRLLDPSNSLVHPNSLGQAACALQANIDALNSAGVLTGADATDDQTVATFQCINRLAQELEAADYTFEGLRESDKNWSLDDVLGGIHAGLSADLKFIEGIGAQAVANVEQIGKWAVGEAGKAAGAAAGAAAGVAGAAAGAVVNAIVSSPLFWVAGLGLVGYVVLRRSM